MKAPKLRIRDLLLLTMVGAVASLFAKWQYEQYLVDSYYDALARRDKSGVRSAKWWEFEAEFRSADAVRLQAAADEKQTAKENQTP